MLTFENVLTVFQEYLRATRRKKFFPAGAAMFG